MMAAAIAAACRLVTGAVVEWRCDPAAGGQRIYFGNHSSHLDFVVIWASLPPSMRDATRPVAGADYWQKGALRPYVANRVFHAILIARSQAGAAARSATRDSFERMTRALDEGGSLIVFPEGTRSRDGEVGPFKSGLFHLAQARPQAQLVPVYLQNLNRILPKGEVLPVPMLSRVVFGRPLHAAAGEDKTSFLQRARTALVELRPHA